MLYRRVLRKLEYGWVLYIAVRQTIFDTFFQRPLVQEIVRDEQMNLLIFDEIKNTVVAWKNWNSIESG